ncbi:MAG: hypothetical protein LBK50_00610 [Candidatus Nomurabacteria bacterium]|jgi:hypothetical protein|nr:hypothetical protein [Candidatus Nomurabacteria bacterium]
MDGNTSSKNTGEVLTPQNSEPIAPEISVDGLQANPNLETPIEAGKETEQALSNQESQPTVIPTATPVPTQPQQPVVTLPQSDNEGEVTDTLPTVAGHGNKIEKEWVDMGEKIIEQTKADPHQQKDKIDNLRDTYQAARYGAGSE